MAITRTQIAKQLLANGGRIGYSVGGRDGPSSSGNTGRDRGMGLQGKTGKTDKSLDTGGGFDKVDRSRTKTIDRLNRIADIEKFIDRPKFGFTDAAKVNLLSPSSLAKTAFGALIGVPGLGFLSNINVNPNPTDDEDDDDDNRGNGDGDNYIPPLMAQAPSIVEQEPVVEEEEPFEFYRRFRADGGIMNTDVVGGEMDFDSARQMYGLGKLVKKVTRSVKKIAKSPVGKAALLYAGGAGLSALGAGSAGTGFGMKMFGPKAFASNLGMSLGKLGLGSKFIGPSQPKSLVDMLGGKIGVGILGASAIAGMLTPKQEEEAQAISDETGIDIAEIRANPNKYLARRFRAEGGSTEGKEPVAKKVMPLLDMDGQEKDYRETGGFVDMGRMEKADDVPARLSKNEFVFTDDAVRNAGEGDVDKGAEVMYNMMKNLESGGDVSEESQGLEGARKMFQTSQRLEEVL